MEKMGWLQSSASKRLRLAPIDFQLRSLAFQDLSGISLSGWHPAGKKGENWLPGWGLDALRGCQTIY